MGNVGKGLDNFFVPLVSYHIQHKGEDYGQRETGDDRVNRKDYGVYQYPLKIVRTEKSLKMPETHPGAAPYTPNGRKIFESYLYPEHRVIGEYQKVDQGEEHKQVKLEISFKVIHKQIFLFHAPRPSNNQNKNYFPNILS
jgi:hypothetical protein